MIFRPQELLVLILHLGYAQDSYCGKLEWPDMT